MFAGKLYGIVIVCFGFILIACSDHEYRENEESMEFYVDSACLENSFKVYGNEGISCAFTDLIYFNDQWFLTFRESDKHVHGKDGIIKILSSIDGLSWDLIKEFRKDGIDLRDPKFSINGDRLMLYVYGANYVDRKLISRHEFRSLYSDNGNWEEFDYVSVGVEDPSQFIGNESWPWKVTWFQNEAYTIGYSSTDKIFDLYHCEDGLNFFKCNSIGNITEMPTEAAIKVKNDEFFVLARRNKGTSIIGRSFFPKESFTWNDTIPIVNIGGPDFILPNSNQLLFTGRDPSTGEYKTILGLYDFTDKDYKKLLEFPSGGDCGYAGMVYRKGKLWISYYSSHGQEKGSSIYVAIVSFES